MSKPFIADAVTVTDAADGLIVGSVPIHSFLPETTTQAKACTGLATSIAFWRFDWLNTGNAVSLGDLAGTLTSNGTPTLQKLVSGKTGTHLDAAGDTYSANVLDTAANSFLAGCRVAFVNDPAGTQHNLIGRLNGALVGWVIYVGDTGNLQYFFNDGTNSFGATFTGGTAVAAVGDQPIDIIIQLDRSGGSPVMRARWSRNGANIASQTVAMSTLGSLTAAGQEFGFGPIPVAGTGLDGGAGGWVQFAFIGIGVQAEGSTKALLASQRLGWEA